MCSALVKADVWWKVWILKAAFPFHRETCLTNFQALRNHSWINKQKVIRFWQHSGAKHWHKLVIELCFSQSGIKATWTWERWKTKNKQQKCHSQVFHAVFCLCLFLLNDYRGNEAHHHRPLPCESMSVCVVLGLPIITLVVDDCSACHCNEKCMSKSLRPSFSTKV